MVVYKITKLGTFLNKITNLQIWPSQQTDRPSLQTRPFRKLVLEHIYAPYCNIAPSLFILTCLASTD